MQGDNCVRVIAELVAVNISWPSAVSRWRVCHLLFILFFSCMHRSWRGYAFKFDIIRRPLSKVVSLIVRKAFFLTKANFEIKDALLDGSFLLKYGRTRVQQVYVSEHETWLFKLSEHLTFQILRDVSQTNLCIMKCLVQTALILIKQSDRL